ncbi:complement C4-B-like [Terrapene carolina triunguis]|uniref:complement C4-B-like n=1 Tax=Terrapene triunguis TaxID=2587831 RepID=UPI000E77B013|nr:complement C4-B-like [Terrapene carolina triunguis]
MIYMAPGLYAMHYLDETEQWTQLKPERKQEGLEHLRVGYERILTFRKPDGSYGAWLHRASSTWLTAFVVKVLALSRQYQAVDNAGIRESVTWLLGNQQADGSFRDPQPVIHRDMQVRLHVPLRPCTLAAACTMPSHTHCLHTPLTHSLLPAHAPRMLAACTLPSHTPCCLHTPLARSLLPAQSPHTMTLHKHICTFTHTTASHSHSQPGPCTPDPQFCMLTFICTLILTPCCLAHLPLPCTFMCTFA